MRKRLLLMLLIAVLLACCIQVLPAGRYEIYGEEPVLSGRAFRGEFTFLAPPETSRMIVRVEEYQGGEWRPFHEVYMDTGKERKSFGGFGGTAAVTSWLDSSVLLDLDFCGSKGSSTVPYTRNASGWNSIRQYLREGRPIPMDEKFPIAIFIFDEADAFRTFTLDIYDEPDRLREYRLVQAVTLEFTTADGAGE